MTSFLKLEKQASACVSYDQVAKISGHMKPGYQNFQVNFQIPSGPPHDINNGISLKIRRASINVFTKTWLASTCVSF